MGRLLGPSAGGFFHLAVYFSLAVPVGKAGAIFPAAVPVILLVAEIANAAVRVFARMQGRPARAARVPEVQGVVQWLGSAGALSALAFSGGSATRPALVCGWAASAASAAFALAFLCLNRAILKRSFVQEPAAS